MEKCSDALQVSRPTLLSWISGDKEPKEYHRKAIHRWTSGEIDENEWPSSKVEQALLDRVEPFTPPTGTDS